MGYFVFYTEVRLVASPKDRREGMKGRKDRGTSSQGGGDGLWIRWVG